VQPEQMVGHRDAEDHQECDDGLSGRHQQAQDQTVHNLLAAREGAAFEARIGVFGLGQLDEIREDVPNALAGFSFTERRCLIIG